MVPPVERRLRTDGAPVAVQDLFLLWPYTVMADIVMAYIGTDGAPVAVQDLFLAPVSEHAGERPAQGSPLRPIRRRLKHIGYDNDIIITNML